MKPFDFDSDNDMDLLVATEGEKEDSSPALLFMANDGKGNLSAVDQLESRRFGNTLIEMSDIDADSFMDIVLVAGSSRYTVFYGSDTGFGPETEYQFSGLTPDIAFMDLNGDLSQEAIIPSGFIDRVGLQLNNGNRTFTQLEYASIGLDASSIFKADFDGDESDEFLVVHSESMTLDVITFTCTPPETNCSVVAKTVVELNEPRGLLLADVNGDSFADLITTFDEASIAVQTNDGTGTFNPPSVF